VTGKGLRLESYETLFSIKLFPISGGVCVRAHAHAKALCLV
jgi:hypothetical protein